MAGADWLGDAGMEKQFENLLTFCLHMVETWCIEVGGNQAHKTPKSGGNLASLTPFRAAPAGTIIG